MNMSYVQEVLQPGEQVRYQASIHWVTYLHGLLWLLAAAIVWMIVPAPWRAGFVAEVVAIMLVAGGVFFLARAWFNQWITRDRGDQPPGHLQTGLHLARDRRNAHGQD
jgi:glucan phosphoethanolaminetransferase (alkaline phosphatase superfamily)